MSREQALHALRADATGIRSYGVLALYMFGSTARGEAMLGSDIDLFVDDDDRLDLFGLAGLQSRLSDLLGRPVDIGTRDGLHPALRHKIEGEAIRVF